MGNCLSSSSSKNHHHHHVRVKGLMGQDDAPVGGGGAKLSPHKNKLGHHLQNGEQQEQHLDSTDTSVFDGTEVDTNIPLSPDPAATLDTSTMTTTPVTTPTGGTATTTATTATSPVMNGNGIDRSGGGHVHEHDDVDDYYDDDDDGVSVEAALMTTLIAPHKRTDDSPGTEQPAVIFSLLSEDVSSVRSSNSKNSHTRRTTPTNGQQQQQQHAVIVAPSKAFSLATGHHQLQQPQQPHHHHHTRQGRALQARLQKARYMQMAMTKSSPSSTRSLNSESVSSFSSIPEDDDDYQVSNAGHLPLRYSMSNGSEMSTPHNHHTHHKRHRSGSAGAAAAAGLMNEEFEANMNKGMIWAEVERDHAVLAVALSRQKPTLLHYDRGGASAHTPPPLFLAVGTETGTVTVTELLDDSTSPLLNRALSSPSAARLGSTVSITPFPTTRGGVGGGRIRSLDFSPNGNYLAVAGDDCICAICRLDFVGEQEYSSQQLTRLQVVAEISRVDRIYAVQFSPNGAFLAIGGFDGTVAIVSMMEQQQLQQQPRGAAAGRGRRGGSATSTGLEPVVVREIPCDSLVLTLDFSPDGQYLAIGLTNKTCVLVDVTDSWQVVYTIRRPASVQTVQWHPNGGRYLAIGSNDVVILDRETLTIKHELDVRGGGRDEAPTRSGMSPGSPNGRYQQQQQQQQRSVFRVKNVCWSPNGSFLVTNGSDNTCKLLETKTYTTIHEIRRSGITSVVWGQQNVIAGIPHRYLAMGGDDKKVVILKAGLEIDHGNSSVGDDFSSAASSYFSNRGDWVLRENAFRDVEESASHVTLYASGGGGGPTLHSTGSRNGSPVDSLIHAVAFSRGSKSRPSAFFAVASGDGQVTIRSTLGWKIISQTRFLNPTLCMAFSNGSRLLALGGEDGKLRLVATAPLWSVIAEVSFVARINSLAFSKNNERIAVGSGDGILSFVCPQDNFRVVGEITENGSDILCIDWSSKNLAVGRENGVVHIHDSDNIFHGRQKASAVLECRNAVRSVAFGASSRFLVTGGDDGVIGVYSARGGWVLVHQISAGFGISTLKWSPSGRHLVYTGDSNQVQVVDTIFWAEVGEASSALWVPTAKTSGQVSFAAGLSFSQDGKMIAFSSIQSGTRIINTASWDVVLTLAQPAAQQPSPVVSEESSSISSPEEEQGHLGSASE